MTTTMHERSGRAEAGRGDAGLVERRLLRICEPAFELAALIGMASGFGSDCSEQQMRDGIRSRIDRISRELRRPGSDLAGLADDVCWMLTAFLDAAVVCSSLPVGRAFRINRESVRDSAGFNPDKKFFDDLDALLERGGRDDLVRAQLAVYRACLQLGMTGCHHKQPEEIRRYHDRLVTLLDGAEATGDYGSVDRDANRHLLCPDAYRDPDNRVLWPDVAKWLRPFALFAVVALLASLAVSYYLWQEASTTLRSSVEALAQPNRDGMIRYDDSSPQPSGPSRSVSIAVTETGGR